MKNLIICENCKTENHFYLMNCEKCGALLRNKVPNIDLFSTVWGIIETPFLTIKKVVFAEHKNYLFLLLFILLLKLSFSSFFVHSLLIAPLDYQNYFTLNLLIGLGSFLFIILLLPLLIKVILESKNIDTRYKDNLAITVYSQTPLVLFMIFILPVEFALFGKYWLFSNPSPFIIKETVAYILSALEALTFIWASILLGVALFVQSKSKVFSLLFAFAYFLILITLFVLIPYLE